MFPPYITVRWGMGGVKWGCCRGGMLCNKWATALVPSNGHMLSIAFHFNGISKPSWLWSCRGDRSDCCFHTVKTLTQKNQSAEAVNHPRSKKKKKKRKEILLGLSWLNWMNQTGSAECKWPYDSMKMNTQQGFGGKERLPQAIYCSS